MTELELLSTLNKELEDLLTEAKEMLNENKKTWFNDKQNKI